MTSRKDAIWVFLDNEGPCTLNDNAQESTVALARKYGLGEKVGVLFYKNTSNIDDIWGDFHRIAKDPDYSSGHTLKVVLPFFKAMGANSQWSYDFANDSLRVVPNIGKVLANLNWKYNLWKISTSYQFFIKAFCDRVNFDFSKVRCTFIERFDEIPITREDSKILLEFMKEVAQMPTIKYDGETGQVIKEHQAYYDRFTEFIWETVYNMPVGELLRIVHPVGQTQKREAVEEICQEFKVPKEKVFYVGDSQTDVQVVEWLRGQGLTMMFNGKGRVCHLSDIAYIGEDARVIEEVADLFTERGRQAVIDYYQVKQIPRYGLKVVRKASSGGILATVTPENAGWIKELSLKKRKEFRGVHIGELT